jgi:GMP synthase (glutamine-hydrolysing)
MSRVAGSKLRIHYLQHAPFEPPAGIAAWALRKGHHWAGSRLYLGEPLPGLDDFDWLVAMGGPMSVHDEALYPWLTGEKKLIEQATKARKRILGVCLGAQLLADVLGAKVRRSRHKEIGWFPVHLTPQGDSSGPLRDFPQSFPSFHWHGETFEIPAGAVHLATTEACKNQAFEFGGIVVGLQFHLEVTRGGVRALIQNCQADLDSGQYQQPPDQMLARKEEFGVVRRLLPKLLERMAGQ